MVLTETLIETLKNVIASSVIGAWILGAIVFLVIIAVAFWIYTSLAWATIGKKLKHKNPWIAWIPFARTGLILELGKFHWAFAFLYLVPIIGWAALAVLCIIAHWKIFETRNYPGWFALIPIASLIPIVGGLAGITYLVILGIVAWKDTRKRR